MEGWGGGVTERVAGDRGGFFILFSFWLDFFKNVSLKNPLN